MSHLSRTNARKIAAVLSLLLGIYAIVWAIPYLVRGADAVAQANDGPPFLSIVVGPIIAAIKIVGAWGTWQNQRWGILLILVTNAVDILLGAPGLLFAPTMRLRVESSIFTALEIVIIVLCLWRERRPVMTGRKA